MSPEPLFSDEALLASPFVRSVEILAEVESTNNHAKRRAASLPAASLPLLVVAQRQTAGRGRGANRWWSADGALTFSVAINPAAHGLGDLRSGALSVATALAVCDALERSAGVRAEIKWPNDVLVGGKKIAGVLLESPRRDRVVIGVGVNVANSLAEAPEEVRDVATSLTDHSPSPPSPQGVLVELLGTLAGRIDQLALSDKSLAEEWNARSALTGMRITLAQGEGEIVGECVGLAEDGALRLLHDGVLRHYKTGTVASAIDGD